MKKVLFIDRDGTLILEPEDFQIDSLEKLEFYPEVFRGLGKIARELDYELVMVSNQDGLGTESFPEADFWPSHHALLKALKNEGIVFSDILIDRSLPEDQAPTRKPGTGMLNAYLHGKYDLANSLVIGDRATDVQLAKNLGCKSIYMGAVADVKADLSTNSWDAIYDYLKNGRYTAQVERKTKETNIRMVINLRGSGQAQIKTGLHFLDHMLDQIARHGNVDLEIKAKGDLEVDEHHTVEDVGIALGMAIDQALGDKRGIERYGFQLPMDDAYAQVALDLGGRAHFKWKAKFKREYVGDVPTELFPHFFESLCMAAKMNLRIQAQGKNEHHKIEAIFKGFARALKMAVREDERFVLPSTKGQL